MSFISVAFLVFLPLVFLIYWALQRHLRCQNIALLTASYVFYAWWDWRFLFLILITSASSFAHTYMEELQYENNLDGKPVPVDQNGKAAIFVGKIVVDLK